MNIIEAIIVFADDMKRKASLRKDRHGMDFDASPKATDWYFTRMVEELGELAKELRQPYINPLAVQSECADIANFAACLNFVAGSAQSSGKPLPTIAEGMPTNGQRPSHSNPA
jgi:NTP pyrophosphatase (non-canonical NTP hydrolase)